MLAAPWLERRLLGAALEAVGAARRSEAWRVTATLPSRAHGLWFPLPSSGSRSGSGSGPSAPFGVPAG